jgi:hypothetical protein
VAIMLSIRIILGLALATASSTVANPLPQTDVLTEDWNATELPEGHVLIGFRTAYKVCIRV